MGDDEETIANRENTLHLFKDIKGLFISLNKETGRVVFYGNNREIIGIDENVVVLTLSQLSNFIDSRYTDLFYNYINGKDELIKETEFILKNAIGKVKWLNIKGKVKRKNLIAVGFEGYISDITEEKQNYFQHGNVQTIDMVTGLHNRLYLNEKIDEYFEKNKDSKSRSALIILGLDNFKYINDSFGSECGDKFLKVISQELRSRISEEEYLCRLDGDEFLIFLPNIKSLSDVENKAKNLIKAFNKSYNIDDNQIYVTTSMGLSVYPVDGEDFEKLLKNADTAMYTAKNNGKNQYQFFNNNISRELDKVYAIQKGLLTALDKNEMFVVFQPKVTLNQDKVNGFEALIRWNSSELGFISPADFIPIAELTGAIIPIGNFVLSEVFQRVRYLLNSGYDDFKIAFNLSEVQLRDGTVVDLFKRLSNKYDVPGRYIEIEITESMLMKSVDRNIKYLLKLKDLGASIALDDFGTGYSSFNHLTKLPIDVLKIDRTFVIDMIENHKSRWIIENIIQLSHKLGISVVAEGVELKEQVDYLKTILCDIVQGYYYSKPESFENAISLLDK
jgi:diguanylate cyclase (GGDEF)-like protein